MKEKLLKRIKDMSLEEKEELIRKIFKFCNIEEVKEEESLAEKLQKYSSLAGQDWLEFENIAESHFFSAKKIYKVMEYLRDTDDFGNMTKAYKIISILKGKEQHD